MSSWRSLLKLDTDMMNLRLVPFILALSGSLLLAACESDEDKAERYFQSGLALLEAGDEERALVEFRNVFKYDGFHKEARRIYADTIFENGNVQEAYSQYLRLIEQYPNTADVRRQLTEIAISRGDWEEAMRHGNAAIELTPDVPRVQAIQLVLAYREASLERDEAARTTLAQDAASLLETLRTEEDSDGAVLVRIIIDYLISIEDVSSALGEVKEALSRDPQAEDLNLLLARLLAQTGDIEGTSVQLRKMVEMFPENQEIQQALIDWYMSRRDFEGAEIFLRELAGSDTGPTEGHLSVVQMLRVGEGVDAARAELERLAAANKGTENGRLYEAMLATMIFDAGDAKAGIAAFRAALDGAEPSDQTRRLQVMLAHMLEASKAHAEARALVEEVLTADASNVEALKMRAGWLIEVDKPGDAILALRSALNQSPRDPQILTLMAQAHERDGDIELAGERLALAVDVTGSRAEEALRYARFLVSQDRLPVAVTVLENARRSDPRNINVLSMLADIRLRTRELARAQTIVRQLRDIGTPESRRVAIALHAQILQEQGRTEDSLALLKTQIGNDAQNEEGSLARSITLVIQAQVNEGDFDAARTTIDEALADSPDDSQLQFLDAILNATMGDFEAAITGYESLIDRFPESVQLVRALTSVLNSNGRPDEAAKALAGALERMPDQPDLLWMKASAQENEGDIDGALTTYEELYAQNSNSKIVANNLASLLGTHRDDPDSLQRATAISRRLRGTDVPAFQDTYGWIAFRRGDLEEAVSYLEPAAAALTEDPLVQYHLGMIYAALNRTEAAKETLRRATELAEDSSLPQFQTARQTLEELDQQGQATD